MANTRTKTSPIVSACWAEHTLAIVRVTIILLIHVNPLPIIPSWLLGKPTLPAQRQPQLGTSLQYGTGNTQLTELLCTRNSAGPWFNIKMSSCQYRKSHCGDKTILRPSYLHNGISYTLVRWHLYIESGPRNLGVLSAHLVCCRRTGVQCCGYAQIHGSSTGPPTVENWVAQIISWLPELFLK